MHPEAGAGTSPAQLGAGTSPAQLPAINTPTPPLLPAPTPHPPQGLVADLCTANPDAYASVARNIYLMLAQSLVQALAPARRRLRVSLGDVMDLTSPAAVQALLQEALTQLASSGIPAQDINSVSPAIMEVGGCDMVDLFAPWQCLCEGAAG